MGVDPQSRNHIFESVERLNREQGMSLLYTTHYMEEAERLCHRVGIIDRGKLIALDTPRNLIAQLGGGIIQVGVAAADEQLASAVAALPAVKTVSFVTTAAENGQDDAPSVAESRAILKIEASQGNDALLQVLHYFNEQDVDVLSLDLLLRRR